MEHIDHHVHDNHMVLGIVCCCFVCFMFAGFAFMEKGKCMCFVSLDLEDELACLFVLVFAFHEDWCEFGFNWHIRLWKDEEPHT